MVDVLVINDKLVLRSGITMVIKNLIENSDRTRIRYTLLTGKDERNNCDYFRNLGIEVYEMPNFKSLHFFSCLSFFDSFFATKRFDIVHSHFIQLDNFVFAIARKYGVKICISHSHSARLSESPFKAFINKMLCLGLSKRADYCAACSEQAGKAVFGRNFPKLTKGMIIKNGIDCSKFAYSQTERKRLRTEYSLSDDCIVIGHTGRFSAGKNQAFLIRIFMELLSHGGNYVLFLIGEGETKKDLERTVNGLGLSNKVFFAGGIDNVCDYLNIFDIYIMPSIHEGLGISAIEAQANGLECVLSTSIPKEADLTGVIFRDLSEPVSIWVDTISTMSGKRHIDYNDKVIAAGYDVRTVGSHITDFYVNITK